MESRENKILDRLGLAAAVSRERTVNLEHTPKGWDRGLVLAESGKSELGDDILQTL